MNKQKKYDPEDIESLLLHKEFKNLYPEERTFVLEHLEDEEEYNSMRSMLLAISETNNLDEIEPQDKTFDTLMREFETEEKSGLTWWFSGLFSRIFPQEKNWYFQPGFQLAIVAGVLILGFLIFPNNDSSNQIIAEVNPKNKTETKQKTKDLVTQKNTENIGSQQKNESAEENNTMNIKQTPSVDDKITTAKIGSLVDDLDGQEEMNEKRKTEKSTDINPPAIAETNNFSNELADVIVEEDFAIAEDEAMEVEEEEEEITSPTIRVPTTTNTFDLDQTVGNSTSPVSLESVRNNESNLVAVATQNLAANNALIDLLYTAP